MMEYFNSGVTDNFSLQEMIENDMNTDFGDHLMNGTSADMDVFNCIPEPIFTIPAEPEASMESTELGAASAMETDASDKLSAGDLSWLQTVNLSALKAENSDPNLLVNPQTGLPTLHSTDQLLSASGAQDAAVVTSLPSVQPQVIHIQQQVSPMSPSPSSPMSPVPQTIVKTEHTLTKAGTISLALSSQPVQVIQNTQNRPVVTVQTSTASSLTSQLLSGGANKMKGARIDAGRSVAKVFPKPVYSYSCLIAMALKNCDSGALPVSEIYSFMTENFPYFKTAPDGWKNSVRHNLSLNKCFEKIDNPRTSGNSRKGCLWGLNPDKIDKMDDEIAKWRKKDPVAIKRSMAKPESLEMLEKGIIGLHNQRHAKVTPSTLPSGVVRTQASTTVRLVPIQVTSPQVVASHQAIPAGAQTSDDVRVSMVEVTPKSAPARVVIKKETMGQEEGLNRDDLEIIDTALNLDPNLNDLQLQQNLWDELASDMVHYDDFPLVSSTGLNTALSSSAQAAWSGVVLGHTGTPAKNISSISRTISAQT